MPQSELGAFLQARRAAVSPGEAGLPETGRRRVPGLRREEVAALVGLSTDYYVRLEQGRGGRPSESVLDAIGDALRLDPTQRAHLNDLAHPVSRRRRVRSTKYEKPSGSTQAFFDTLTVPAALMTRCTHVIAWNPLASSLFTDFGAVPEDERTMARMIFLDEDVAARHRDWNTAARDVVGILRMAAGREPDNTELTELVGDLAVRSDVFRRLWAEHHVHEKTHGAKLLRHPEVGDIDLAYATWLIPDSPNQMLITYTVEPNSRSAEALALLGTVAATPAPSAVAR